jgi:hypothetical protein
MLVLVAAVVVAAASPAVAGTYTVNSCTLNPVLNPPLPIVGVDDAWVFDTNDSAHFESVRTCPPADDRESTGMVAQTKLNSGGPAVGRFAAWRFDAPAGTELSHLRIWQTATKNTTDWELYAGTNEGNIPDSDCVLSPLALDCSVASTSVPIEYSFAPTSSLQVGLRCSFATTSCSTGATLHDAWSAMYATVVTVNDTTAATASDAGGTLLAGGYIHGTVTASVNSGSDGSGIRALKVLVDGNRQVARTPDRACDFSRRAPCPQLTTPESFSFDSRSIPDGTHSAAIGVVDTGENFTPAGTQQITVDNTAPFAPIATSPTSTATGTATVPVSWLEPGGQVSPITAAHITVCGPAGCSTTTQPAGTGAGSATVGVPAVGTYTVSVALEDAVGNFAAGQAAVWTINRSLACACPGTVTPLPLPQPTPTPKTSPRLTTARPTVARDRRTVSVTGTVAPGVTGKVTIKASAKIHGGTRTVTKRAPIRGRRYAVRLTLPSAAWRTATITVRFPGDAAHRSARITRRVSQRQR